MCKAVMHVPDPLQIGPDQPSPAVRVSRTMLDPGTQFPRRMTKNRAKVTKSFVSQKRASRPEPVRRQTRRSDPDTTRRDLVTNGKPR